MYFLYNHNIFVTGSNCGSRYYTLRKSGGKIVVNNTLNKHNMLP